MADSDRASREVGAIRYRRLRAPARHGTVLQDPPLDSSAQLIANNKAVELSAQWNAIRKHARAEIIERAAAYTSQYRDVDLSGRDQSTVIMSGHQPSLFHPGVWYKNFALSALGQKHNAVAINLVVDNDICGVGGVRVPLVEDGGARFKILPTDQPGDNLPFEERQIEDLTYFKDFPSRATDAIKPFVSQPIVNELWPLVMQHAKSESSESMGAAFSKGRHQLEGQHGLTTFEIPISKIAKLHAFASFVKLIACDIQAFAQTYNKSLSDYRTVHKIRSRSHPVPELRTIEDWHETPFWIWDSKPIRRSLYIKQVGNNIQCSDRQEIEFTIPINSFEDAFRELPNRNIAVRPKALATTMFARLALSDLFIHGIGGSKYDQLTDAIIRRHFDIEPPAFITVTATMKLTDQFDSVNKQAVTKKRHLLRDYDFHPEQFVEADEIARPLIANKRMWIETEGRSRERHQGIAAANAQLRTLVQTEKLQLESEIAELKTQLRTSEILGSREFSFCLHSKELVESLSNLANL